MLLGIGYRGQSIYRLGSVMRVLVACEYSGIVREAFAARGHDAWSCDLLPTEIPGQHHQGDAIEFAYDGGPWDLMIAHPVCTFLCNSGVCHLHTDKARWPKMRDGAKFFKMLGDAPIEKKCLENPIMHKYAVAIIGRRQDQVIQPWMFGHMEQKATCLWLWNLDPLEATNNVKAAMLALPKNQRERLHYMSPGPQRAHERSRTFQGIADAMADQWGNL